MYKFTIRDVLWLMVVVALATTRWADNRRLEAEKSGAEARQAAVEKKYGDLLSKHTELNYHYKKWQAEGR